ncbi:MAG TPA: isopentenyl phosphate kinase [archaeon]|nr:isopentenyl phosphate kinase [archaeon]
MDLTIIKVGGSVITDKKSLEPKVNEKNLEIFARDVSEIFRKNSARLIICHGAGSYGHQIVKRTGIHKGIETAEQVHAFAETQKQMNELNVLVCSALLKNGVPAIPTQVSANVVMDAGRISEWDTKAIEGFLEVGMVPVVYGVPAFDKKQKCSILSGDQIAPFLAKKLGARKIIHGTNVDGIFTADPNLDSAAERIPEINSENLESVKNLLGESSATDVTGGMFGKVSELLDLGVESQIVNAFLPGRVVEAFEGKSVGTKIVM